jgi:phage regulator Rha-like protein
MTSLEIAQVTGKTHAHVLRDIRNMEPAWEQEHGTKFGLMQQRENLPNGGYRLRPVFVLSKIESLYIATKFNDAARARLVLRWEELEREVRCKKEDVRSEPQKLLETEEEVLSRADAIRRQEIAAENAPADGCLTVTEIAGMLGTTVKELNRRLVAEGVQYPEGGRYKLTPKYEGRGLAKDRLFSYYALDGEKKERSYLVWTKLGVEMIFSTTDLTD